MTPAEETIMLTKLDEVIEKLEDALNSKDLSIVIQEKTIDKYREIVASREKEITELNTLADTYGADNERLLYEIAELQMRLNRKSWWQFWK